MTSMHRAVRERRVGDMKTPEGVRVVAAALLAQADAMRYQRTIGPARYALMLRQVDELYSMANVINDLTPRQVTK